MNNLEGIKKEIMEYIYNRGNEGSKMVGYEKGVFSTVYFEVQEIIEALDHDEESVEAAITELYSDSHIEFKKGRVGLNETGMRSTLISISNGKHLKCKSM